MNWKSFLSTIINTLHSASGLNNLLKRTMLLANNDKSVDKVYCIILKSFQGGSTITIFAGCYVLINPASSAQNETNYSCPGN